MGICPNKCLVHSFYRIVGRRRFDFAWISTLDVDCRLANSQYIITLHTDSKSGILHLHLDCNRVDMDNCLNSDHLIGIRAKTAAEEVNRLRNWKRTKERFEENKARIKKDCLAILSGMSSFSWEKYTAALEAKGYKVKLKLDASVTVRGYSI